MKKRIEELGAKGGSMKRGYTILEMIVIITLVSIVLGVASLSITRVNERKDILNTKSKIADILSLYIENSYATGKTYRVEIDLSSSSIEVDNIDTGDTIEVEELSGNLSYYLTKDSDGDLNYEEVETDSSGGMDSFSIYIFNYNDKAVYRISVDNIANSSGLAYVNVYRNLNADVTVANVGSYVMNYSQWEEE